MKGAHLWKRILNNGLHTAKWFADTADADAFGKMVLSTDDALMLVDEVQRWRSGDEATQRPEQELIR